MTVMATWDAADYAKNSQGQYNWAISNLGKLGLTGSEVVLDVGCGDGKISAEIASRVPSGRVLGVDQSDKMIDLARNSHSLSNLEFLVQDAQILDFLEESDRVFSNSAIHWMPNQEAVVRGIARALRPGGRIFLSMGGRGTAFHARTAIEELMATPPWDRYLAGASSPHHFYGPEEYEPWLTSAGLRVDRVELVPKPMRLRDARALHGWLRTTWMTYVQRMPEPSRVMFLRAFMLRVLSGCQVSTDGSLTMPMVNLEVEAHRE